MDTCCVHTGDSGHRACEGYIQSESSVNILLRKCSLSPALVDTPLLVLVLVLLMLWCWWWPSEKTLRSAVMCLYTAPGQGAVVRWCCCLMLCIIGVETGDGWWLHGAGLNSYNNTQHSARLQGQGTSADTLTIACSGFFNISKF